MLFFRYEPSAEFDRNRIASIAERAAAVTLQRCVLLPWSRLLSVSFRSRLSEAQASLDMLSKKEERLISPFQYRSISRITPLRVVTRAHL
jgi:hypothetical protein